MTVTRRVSWASKPLSRMFLSFSVVLFNSGDATEPSWGLREVRRCFNQEIPYIQYTLPLFPDVNASIWHKEYTYYYCFSFNENDGGGYRQYFTLKKGSQTVKEEDSNILPYVVRHFWSELLMFLQWHCSKEGEENRNFIVEKVTSSPLALRAQRS